MARITAKNVGIAASGRDVSGRSNNMTLTLTAEAPEVTGFGEGTRARLPDGLADIELGIDGFFDSSASQVDELFQPLVAASSFWGVFNAGFTACNIGREFTGILTEYTVNTPVADATTTTITVAASPPILDAKVLATGSLVGTASGAANGVDYGAATTGSVYGIMRVLAVAGTQPQIAASLQDSTNDSTWATLFEFTTTSFGGNYNYAVAPSAARYRRFKYLVGASGAATGSAGVLVTCGSIIYQ